MENEVTIQAAQKSSEFCATSIITDQTKPIIDLLKHFTTPVFWGKLAGTVLMLIILYVLYRIVNSMIKRIPEKGIKHQYVELMRKVLKYIYYFAVCAYILGLFGIKLSVIWGAAGVAGVAIGFASQTSVSNIISGLFVLSERSMHVGDLITVDGITGIVDSIDLLSIKIHTLDNQLVRIPNSTIIDTKLINTSYFPYRRMSIAVAISYDVKIDEALEVLKKAPELCPTVLKDPEPAVWVDSFGESGINLVLAVWFNQSDFRQTKNDSFVAIQKVFGESKITIPYNHLDVTILQ